MFTPWHTSKLLRGVPRIENNGGYQPLVLRLRVPARERDGASELAARRTVHIHGRVGYAEGPQVPHPAAPEYKEGSGKRSA